MVTALLIPLTPNENLESRTKIFASPMKISWSLMKIMGSPTKSGVSNENIRVSNKNKGFSNENMGVSNINLMSPNENLGTIRQKTIMLGNGRFLKAENAHLGKWAVSISKKLSISRNVSGSRARKC